MQGFLPLAMLSLHCTFFTCEKSQVQSPTSSVKSGIRLLTAGKAEDGGELLSPGLSALTDRSSPSSSVFPAVRVDSPGPRGRAEQR